jgi:hypothetical protein
MLGFPSCLLFLPCIEVLLNTEILFYFTYLAIPCIWSGIDHDTAAKSDVLQRGELWWRFF